MLPVRRLDGTAPRETSVQSSEGEALAALAEAVQIADSGRLMSHLARCWRRIAQAKSVALAVKSRDLGHFWTVVIDNAGLITTANLQCGEETDLVDQLSRLVDRSSSVDRSIAHDDVTVRWLQRPPDVLPLGVMLLVEASPLPQNVESSLRDASTELLARACERDRLLREAKLEAMAEFAAGAGHEINNPLAAISGRAQLLLRDEEDPERRRHLATIGAQALRIRDMIGDTMLFARPPCPQPQLLALPRVLDDVVDRVLDDCRERGLTIKREHQGDVPIWADKTQLCIVLSELFRNAIHASPPAGIITVTASLESAGTLRWARFTIRDDGEGLSKEAAEHLFDPFYSGRPAGRGLGFGLSKCWRIVTNHGGRIEARNRSECGERGFEITVWWPADGGVAREGVDQSTEHQPSGARG